MTEDETTLQSFRDQFERLLELVDEQLKEGRVTGGQIEGLRIAVARHRKEGIALLEGYRRMPDELQRVGNSFLGLLRDADRECSPDEVREFEELIDERLLAASVREIPSFDALDDSA